MTPQAILQKDITPTGDDYAIVSHIIERISKDYRDQPSLEKSGPRYRSVSDRAAEIVHALGRSFTQRLSSGGDH